MTKLAQSSEQTCQLAAGDGGRKVKTSKIRLRPLYHVFQSNARQVEAELFLPQKGNVNPYQEIKKKLLIVYFVTHRNFFNVVKKHYVYTLQVRNWNRSDFAF